MSLFKRTALGWLFGACAAFACASLGEFAQAQHVEIRLYQTGDATILRSGASSAAVRVYMIDTILGDCHELTKFGPLLTADRYSLRIWRDQVTVDRSNRYAPWSAEQLRKCAPKPMPTQRYRFDQVMTFGGRPVAYLTHIAHRSCLEFAVDSECAARCRRTISEGATRFIFAFTRQLAERLGGRNCT